jgi:hypothetical protein
MISSAPTDNDIREASHVMLMDSPRSFYEEVNYRHIFRDNYGFPATPPTRLTIAVDSTDLACLDAWRQRIKTLRQTFLGD